jgi:branched-subunit amino acid ABC-type transport system permease component
VNTLLHAVAYGIVSASIIAIASVGFTMQFAVTGVLNLAYGDVMTVSAYVAYDVYEATSSLPLALLCGAAVGGVLSVILNRFVFRLFIRHGTSLVVMVIVTLLTSTIVQNVLLAVAGPNFFVFSVQPGRTIGIGAFQFTSLQLLVLILGVVLMVAVQVLLRLTKIGKAMRATACNGVLARACGIRSSRIIDVAWLISGLLCGLGGVVLIMNTSTFETTTGADFVIVVVAAAVLGGIGSATGAMVGALFVGLVTSITATYTNAALQDVFAFGVLILVLLVRPWGLFGQEVLAREVAG